MLILRTLSTKLIVLFALLVTLTACVSAPVQEMSDARQAIRSAEEAGAAVYSPRRLHSAREILERAQLSLEAGAYFEARRFALDAREQAIQAREAAKAQESVQQP